MATRPLELELEMSPRTRYNAMDVAHDIRLEALIEFGGPSTRSFNPTIADTPAGAWPLEGPAPRALSIFWVDDPGCAARRPAIHPVLSGRPVSKRV